MILSNTCNNIYSQAHGRKCSIRPTDSDVRQNSPILPLADVLGTQFVDFRDGYDFLMTGHRGHTVPELRNYGLMWVLGCWKSSKHVCCRAYDYLNLKYGQWWSVSFSTCHLVQVTDRFINTLAAVQNRPLSAS